MNLATISEDRQVARAKFLEYRHAVRQRHTAEDAALMRGYRHLSLGRQLLHLPDTIAAGGIDEQGRPRLAICRADAVRCYMHRRITGIFFQMDPHMRRSHGRRYRSIEPDPFGIATSWIEAEALVPTIPPALRPQGSLANYWLLWEAEWRPTRAPGDPALLKHLHGPLYVVLAVWDLTPLEQAVLALRGAAR